MLLEFCSFLHFQQLVFSTNRKTFSQQGYSACPPAYNRKGAEERFHTCRNSKPGWCCSTCCMNCVRSPCVRYSMPGCRRTLNTHVSGSAVTNPSLRHHATNSSPVRRSCAGPAQALRNTSYARYLHGSIVLSTAASTGSAMLATLLSLLAWRS